MHVDFKKWLQVFILNDSFSDIEFCSFLLTNHDTIICIIKQKSQYYKMFISFHNQ